MHINHEGWTSESTTRKVKMKGCNNNDEAGSFDSIYNDLDAGIVKKIKAVLTI